MKVLLRIKKHGGVDCWDQSDLALGWKKQTLNDDDDDDDDDDIKIAKGLEPLFLIGAY